MTDVTGTTAHIMPLGEDIEIRSGETLMAAAERQGLTWPTLCNGKGLCGFCWCRVTAGAEQLPPRNELETSRLEAVGRAADPAIRLACQLRPDVKASYARNSVRRRQ